MNEFDEFERELAAMRPREPSPDLEPRIAAGIAAAAEPSSIGRGHAAGVGWFAAGTLLAASLAAVALWLAGDETAERPIAAGATAMESTIAFDKSLPTVWSYRLASKQSGESLDALLDRHGDKGRVNQSADDGIAAFSPFDRGAQFLNLEL